MNMKRTLLCLFLATLAGAVFAGGKNEKKAVDSKIVVAVSLLPQQYFLERIGADRVRTMVLVGPGQDPHSYDPSPRQMASLAQARAWILSGTDFEIGLKPKIASQYPSMKIVDGTEGVAFRLMEEHSHDEEDGDDGDESGGAANIDRHTWLGKEPSKIMAAHIRDTLVALDPAGRSVYEANYLIFLSDIESVFTALKKSLAPLAGKTVLVFHPSFGYFLDEFSMKQESVETGGKEPTAKALSSLIEEARADKTPAIFVQAQFPVDAAKTVAKAVGAEVVLLDPLDPDWLGNITLMGESLRKALGQVK